MWRMGLVAPRHVRSSQTRARTRVPCIGRRILNHCATRETLPLTSKVVFCIAFNDYFTIYQMEEMKLSGPLGYQDFCDTLVMMMNHLVFYYLEIVLCSYAPSMHEGEHDLPKGDQEHVSEVRTPGSVSRSEKPPLFLLLFPFPRNVSYPMGYQLNAL